MPSLSRRIAYNVSVSSAAKVAGTALSLVSLGFITRYLGPAGFGEYSIVLAFFAFFGAFADLGLYSITARDIARSCSDEKSILGTAFFLRLAASTALFALSPLIALLFPYSNQVKAGIMIAALAYVFSSGYSVLIGIFQKRLTMDRVALSEFIGRVVQTAAVIVLVSYQAKFTAIVATLLLNMLVSFLLIFFLARKQIKFAPVFNQDKIKAFLAESYPLGISAIIVFLYFKLDTIILSVMRTSADVGVYNVAYKVVENIAFFPAMLIGLIMPIMSKHIFANRERFIVVADKTFKVFFILATPLVIGAFFLSPGIIALIGGNSYREAEPVLRVLAFAMGFLFFGNFFMSVIIAGKKQKSLIRILSFCAAFNIALNLIFIPRFSFMASAFVSSATELLVPLLSAVVVARELDYRPSFERIPSVIFCGALMAFFLWFCQELNFFLLAPFSVLLYSALIIGTKAVSRDELKSLVSSSSQEQKELIPGSQ